MRQIICILVVAVIFFNGVFTVGSINISVDEVNCLSSGDDAYSVIDVSVPADAQLMTYAKSVVLMEKTTGRILYSENEHDKLYPASVTKIMTILLVCEALRDGKIKMTDKVVCSDNAASKGGSQIWLEPGESMTVDDLLKATCVYSANDACTLLGEYISGSETEFVGLMNKRAAELGMNDTNFDNCTGLDDSTETHLTSAYDIAIMAREVLKYDFVKNYTTIWMDSLRNGETELVNTNKLVRYYKGITGLKTGTTEKAGCCVCATAERDGMELIAVVLGSSNSNDRFKSAENLLDWGFLNYEMYIPEIKNIPETLSVKLGSVDSFNVSSQEVSDMLINKGMSDRITYKIEIQDEIYAPLAKGDAVGKIIILSDNKVLCEYKLTAAENVDKLTFWSAFVKLLKSFS